MGPEEGKRHPPKRIEASDLGLGRVFVRARDAVVVGDAIDGRILLWNDAAAALFCYEPHEATTLAIEDLVPEPLKDQHRAGLARYASTGRGMLIDTGKPVELPALRKDGSMIQVELSLSPLDSGDLPGSFVMAIIRDVTERLEAQRVLAERTEALERSQAQLVEALRELRAVHEELKHVIAVAAHELGNPLTAVIGFSQVLGEQWDEFADSEKRSMLEAIGRQAGKLARLADDLLTASRLDAGTIEPRPESIALATMVEEVLSDFPEAGAVGISVPADLRVRADRQHLGRILGNYVQNAMKHGAPPFEVRAEPSAPMVEISVCDEGEGVADELAATLFGRFVRGRGGTPGAGLGLSIVRGLARANGGEAWYESNTPRGARFCVRVPAATD
jgi:PAS domain S-box-containing protein